MTKETMADDPVYPDDDISVVEEGLTKREHFAAIALQGMLANINQSYGRPNVNDKSMEDAIKRQKQFIDDVALRAVEYSDALIKALNS